jgi:hypothetical protein
VPAGWWRIAAAKDGTVAVGSTAQGRGAWVCSAECFETAVQRDALVKALRRKLTSAEVERVRATLFGRTRTAQ